MVPAVAVVEAEVEPVHCCCCLAALRSPLQVGAAGRAILHSRVAQQAHPVVQLLRAAAPMATTWGVEEVGLAALV